jgi:predicted transcriptional regulator
VADTEQPDLTAMTVQLLSAYFSNNQVPAGDIAGIIEATRGALEGKGEAEAPAPVEHVPAVSVRKSLGSREHIISMIDGKPYKTLKRHLATNGLTPAEYRERYKLPRDYPMVAPAYSEHRRAVAAKLGLGRKASETVQKEAPVAEQAVQEAAPTHAPVMEQKPKRTSRKANTATPADEVAGIGLAQTPESTPAQVPEKPKRSRAKAPDAKPATEAPVIAVETPEAAPMASATPGVSAAAAPAPAPAPAPRKAKGAATKSVAKKPAAKKASPKTSSGAKKPAAAKEAAAPSTTPETLTPEAAKAESSAPALRKKKLGIVTGAKFAASPKAKTPSKRTNAPKKDAAKVDTPASAD